MLHLVNFSPAGGDLFCRVLQRTAAGDCMLLIENGVLFAVRESASASELTAVLTRIPVYALDADLRARGIEEERLIEGIAVTDYSGFVSLVVEHTPVQSWFRGG